MTAKNFLKAVAIGTAVCVFLVLLYLASGCVEKQEREYNERREHRRELVRDCIASGGTPVITQNENGRLTGYYGCTKP